MKLNKGKDSNRELRGEYDESAWFIVEHRRVKNTFGKRKTKWVEDRIQINDDEMDRLITFVQQTRAQEGV